MGTDQNGNPIYLKDIWPSDEEIDALVKEAVKPEQFRKVYIPMFDLGVTEKTKVHYMTGVRKVPISAVRRIGKGLWLHHVHWQICVRLQSCPITSPRIICHHRMQL